MNNYHYSFKGASKSATILQTEHKLSYNFLLSEIYCPSDIANDDKLAILEFTAMVQEMDILFT